MRLAQPWQLRYWVRGVEAHLSLAFRSKVATVVCLVCSMCGAQVCVGCRDRSGAGDEDAWSIRTHTA